MDLGEDLMGFLECDTGISGRFSADKIMNTLQSCMVSHNNDDEAGNMASSIWGTAAVITAQLRIFSVRLTVETLRLSNPCKLQVCTT